MRISKMFTYSFRSLAVASTFAMLATLGVAHADETSAELSAGFDNDPTELASLSNTLARPTPRPVSHPVATRGHTPVHAVSVDHRPLALIYKGPGACSKEDNDAGESGYSCSQASADVARLAGFQSKFVGPDALDEDSTPAEVAALFGHAKLWMQPGGISTKAYHAMTERLRTELVNFIANGGGYVGFCAGAFLATNEIGTTGHEGLGIFPGSTALYEYDALKDKSGEDLGYAFLSTTWLGRKRKLYFEGGPELNVKGTSAEVTAKFDDGTVAAARAAYQKGRVYITGAHPEAPAIWYREDNMRDPDGTDLSLGVEMVKWVSRLGK